MYRSDAEWKKRIYRGRVSLAVYVRGKHVYFNYFSAGHWLRGKRAEAARRTHSKMRTKGEKAEKARNEVLAKRWRELG